MARDVPRGEFEPVSSSIALRGAVFGLPIPVLVAGSVVFGVPAYADPCLNAGGSYPTVICTTPDPNNYPNGITYPDANTGLDLFIDGLTVDRDFGENANAIDVYGSGTGPLRVTIGDDVTIRSAGSIADGVQVHATGTGSGIEIRSGADIFVEIPDGGLNPGVGTSGLFGWISNTSSSQSIYLVQEKNSLIDVNGFEGVGLYGLHQGLGSITIESSGTVETDGERGYGLNGWVTNAASEADVTLTLHETGRIKTEGAEGVGVYSLSFGLGSATANVRGHIETTGLRGGGVVSYINNPDNEQTARIEISETATVIVNGERAAGAFGLHTGAGRVEVDNAGTILATGLRGNGIYALGEKTAEAFVENSGSVRAIGNHGIGIVAKSEGASATVTIGEEALVEGGWQAAIPVAGAPKAAGVAVTSTESTINNRGSIFAGSDLAIIDDGAFGGVLTVNNSGTITGFVEFAGASGNSFTNEAGGLFLVRNFADTDGDGIRDVKAVAVSNFGDLSSTFVNKAGATVQLAAVTSNAQADTTGYYVPTTGTGLATTPLEDSFYSLLRPGVVQGQFLNLGTFTNSGIIDLRGPEIGNTLLIHGSNAPVPGASVYVAEGGQLWLNAVLNEGVAPGGGSGSYADVLILDQTQLGSAPTTIVVDRRDGTGAETTGNGILLVEVRDAEASAPGVFSLLGDYAFDGQNRIVRGLYSYALFHNGVGEDAADGNWYLRTVDYSPTAPVYQEYPKVLIPLIDLPTLQQRGGNRYWRQPAPASTETIFCKDASRNYRCPVTAEQASYYLGNDGSVMIDANGLWGRIEGARGHDHAASATVDAVYDSSLWRIQTGIDSLLADKENGKLVGGFSVHYGSNHGHVMSTVGSGDIEAEGYGVGGSLSWYGTNGFYADAQARVTWLHSDIRSTTLGATLSEDNRGFGYALGIEIGHRTAIGGNWTLTPQAQLVHSHIDFDEFVDPYSLPVALQQGDGLRGRLGIASEYEDRWTAADGTTSRANLYGIANLYSEFGDGFAVTLDGVCFSSRSERLWGEIGIGGTLNWDDDKYALYGEASASTGLANFGESHRLAGTLGMRVRW